MRRRALTIAASPHLAGRSSRQDFPTLGGLLELDPNQLLYFSRSVRDAPQFSDDICLTAGFTDFSIKRWTVGDSAATLSGQRKVLDEFRRVRDHLLDSCSFWPADETGSGRDRQQHVFNYQQVDFFQPRGTGNGNGLGIVLRTPQGAIELGRSDLRPGKEIDNNCRANYFDVIKNLHALGYDPLVCQMPYSVEQTARAMANGAMQTGVEDAGLGLAQAVLEFCKPIHVPMLEEDEVDEAFEKYEAARLQARNDLNRFIENTKSSQTESRL